MRFSCIRGDKVPTKDSPAVHLWAYAVWHGNDGVRSVPAWSAWGKIVLPGANRSEALDATKLVRDISSASITESSDSADDALLRLQTPRSKRFRFEIGTLKKEETLLEYTMVMRYLRGGQAPRITEFFSMLCWNGASSSQSKAQMCFDGEALVHIVFGEFCRQLPSASTCFLEAFRFYFHPWLRTTAACMR